MKALVPTQVTFGVMQSCLEQLTVEIRPCVKVRFLFISLVCIRALNAPSVTSTVNWVYLYLVQKWGKSKMCLMDTTLYLVAGFISNLQKLDWSDYSVGLVHI